MDGNGMKASIWDGVQTHTHISHGIAGGCTIGSSALSGLSGWDGWWGGL